MIGRVLDGRYKVMQVLGLGGFAQTFIAEDIRRPNHPRCVVKQLQPIVANDPNLMQTARRLFQSEADALERLGNHDRVPRLLAHFEENNEFYMVQDLVDGHDLTKELTDGKKSSEAYVVDLLQQLLLVLSFIHGQGVIHRDIKPSNIMRRNSDGKLVLIDFGAVKYINSQTAMAHGINGISGSVAIGTDGYTPSEQLRGKPRPNSDIYSLGMVCLQALTGVYPKDLPENADEEVNWQHLALVSPALTSILNKMVSHSAKNRYQEASTVIQDLQAMSSSPAPQAVDVFSRDSFFNAAPASSQPNVAPVQSQPPVNYQRSPQPVGSFSKDSFFNTAPPQNSQPDVATPRSQSPANNQQNPQQGAGFSRDSFFNAAPLQNPQPDVAPTQDPPQSYPAQNYPPQNYVSTTPPQASAPPPSQTPTYVVPGMRPLPPTAPTPLGRSAGGSNKILLIAAVVISLSAIGLLATSLFNKPSRSDLSGGISDVPREDGRRRGGAESIPTTPPKTSTNQGAKGSEKSPDNSNPEPKESGNSRNVTPPEEPKTDLSPTDAYFPAVQSLKETYGISMTYPDGTFRGQTSISQSEISEYADRGYQSLQRMFPKLSFTPRERQDYLNVIGEFTNTCKSMYKSNNLSRGQFATCFNDAMNDLSKSAKGAEFRQENGNNQRNVSGQSTASKSDGVIQNVPFNLVLESGRSMRPGESRESPNKCYKLTLQNDGNLVVYNKSRPLWGSATENKEVAHLAMQADGNLVMYGYDGQPVWASNTRNSGAGRLVIQDDGNVVLYLPNSNDSVWATNTDGKGCG
ncbi:MAG: protein kinase domain-containing protein [Pseudanabaenaceae cyanobacterium]